MLCSKGIGVSRYGHKLSLHGISLWRQMSLLVIYSELAAGLVLCSQSSVRTEMGMPNFKNTQMRHKPIRSTKRINSSLLRLPAPLKVKAANGRMEQDFRSSLEHRPTLPTVGLNSRFKDFIRPRNSTNKKQTPTPGNLPPLSPKFDRTVSRVCV